MTGPEAPSGASSHVLVTGAAGFLGTALVPHLLRTGRYRITALDRRPAAPAANPPEMRAVQGDIRDARLVGEVLEGVDAVVHCAAALPSHSTAEIRSVDVEGTGTLLEAARRRGTPRFVHLSSTAVYGLPEVTPTPESHPRHAVDPYNTAKIAAERLCERYREGGMCVPVLRPKTFIGPGRLGVFALLFDWALDGRGFPVLGRTPHRNQMLEVSDLCAAVLASLERPAALVDRAFNIGAAEYGTFRDDCQAVLDSAGHGKRVVTLPAAPAAAALGGLSALRLSPVYPRLVHKLLRDSCVDITEAAGALAFSPAHSSTDALLRGFDWYAAHRHRVGSANGRTHAERWREGALRLAKSFF